MDDAPRMTIPVLSILSAMLERPTDEWYGLQFSQQADLKSGTIYPALARLEQAGWLVSRWEETDPAEAGRPRRRLYRLTDEGAFAGRAALDENVRRLSAARGTSRRWQVRGVRPA